MQKKLFSGLVKSSGKSKLNTITAGNGGEIHEIEVHVMDNINRDMTIGYDDMKKLGIRICRLIER